MNLFNVTDACSLLAQWNKLCQKTATTYMVVHITRHVGTITDIHTQRDRQTHTHTDTDRHAETIPPFAIAVII